MYAVVGLRRSALRIRKRRARKKLALSVIWGQLRNREQALLLVEPGKLQGAEGERASIAHRRAAGAVGICLYIHCRSWYSRGIVQTILLHLSKSPAKG